MLFKSNVTNSGSGYTHIVDGNWFFQMMRAATGVTFTEKPEEDAKALTKGLSTKFASFIRKHKQFTDNVIFVRDRSSWRKDVNIVLSEEAQAREKTGYKENRVYTNEIDWGRAYSCFDKWLETIDDKFGVKTFKVEKCEGDDTLYFLADKLVQQNKRVLLYTADGDIQQLVQPNVVVLRATDHLVMDNQTFNAFNPDTSNPMSVFGGKPIDGLIDMHNDMHKPFNPACMLIEKIFKGDPKDNVPEMFYWTSSSGKAIWNLPLAILEKSVKGHDARNIKTVLEWEKNGKAAKPTITHIKKAAKLSNINIEDDAKFDASSEQLEMFIAKLLEVTGQRRNPEVISEEFKSNVTSCLGQIEYKQHAGKDLYYWTSLAGEKTYRPSYSHLNKALTKLGYQFHNLTIENLYDEVFIDRIVKEMLVETNQYRNVELCKEIYKQNLMLLHLDKAAIPANIVENMESEYEKMDFSKNANIESLSDSKVILGKMDTAGGMFDGLRKSGPEIQTSSDNTNINTVTPDDILGAAGIQI